MSDVSVDIIKNRSGEAPDLPSGANLSGVSTAATLQVTNLNPTHINASGVTTATTFSGSLKSTGTPTLGLGVTINSSGVNISGVATAGIVSATTLYGDGSNLTGVAMSIAPISYQPDVNDTQVTLEAGIGITFTERIKAGSGNVTLRLVGAAGTVVENFGVGSSVTINNNLITIDPTANLEADTVYHLSYPSGAFTNTSGDVSYVGTAYTFATKPLIPAFYMWGMNWHGSIPMGYVSDNNVNYSSPVQLPGTTWSAFSNHNRYGSVLGKKTDNTLWAWGYNGNGALGLNNRTYYSSPVQIPGTTWKNLMAGPSSMATKTDNTLWVWGYNYSGELGQNNRIYRSSPTQIPGTNWDKVGTASESGMATKTDGTLWTWGNNFSGQLGLNQQAQTPSVVCIYISSPTQVPGTNWNYISAMDKVKMATKTDGTLWVWGRSNYGVLGQNAVSGGSRSSPVQIPGTNWVKVSCGGQYNGYATKTDGTLWAWGRQSNDDAGGRLGQNTSVDQSSPVQIPGTNWHTTSFVAGGTYGGAGLFMKTDGTLWTWGGNGYGALGQNNRVSYSSPVQIPGEWSTLSDGNSTGESQSAAIKYI